MSSAGVAPGYITKEAQDQTIKNEDAFIKLRVNQFEKYEQALDIEISWLGQFIAAAPKGKSIQIHSEEDIQSFILNSKLLRALKLCRLWDDLFFYLIFDLEPSDLSRLIARFKMIENILDIRERIYLAAKQSNIEIASFSDAMSTV